MNRVCYYILSLFFFYNSYGQIDVYNLSEEITIVGGTSVFINGDFINGENSKGIANGGEIHLTGDLIHNANDSLFITNDGEIIFCGDADQSIIGDSSVNFYKMVLNNANELFLTHNIKIKDTLNVLSGNIFLNSNNIDLQSTGIIVGENNSNRIYGSTGYITAKKAILGNLSNVSGLGLGFESSVSLGNTQITRYNNAQSGASNGGVLRYFKLEPSIQGVVIDKLTFSYFDDNETNNLDEAKYSLWKSQNNAVVWSKEESLPVIGSDFVIAQNVSFDSSSILFTLAESDCDNVPIVDLGKDTVFLCTSDSVKLDAGNPGLFFLWSNGSEEKTITVKVENQYHVRVTDANGCVGYDTIQIIEKPFPVLDFKANFVCQEDISLIENNSTISEDTMSFLWDFGVPDVSNDTSSKVQPSYMYDTAGLYTINLKVVSDFGCEVEMSKIHRVHPLPVASFITNNVCANDTTIFNNNSQIVSTIDGANYLISKYSWDFGEIGDLDTSSLISPNYLYSSINDFTIKLKVESNAGCRDSTETTTSTYPRAELSFEVDSVCFGRDVNIHNNSTISSGTINYVWDFGDGLGSIDPNPQKVYSSTGDFEIKLIGNTDKNCKDSISDFVSIFELPNANFLVNDTCESLALLLSNLSTVPDNSNLSYLWDWDDNSVISTDQTPSKSYNEFGSYDIKLLVTTIHGCLDSITKETEVFAAPKVDFSVTPVCQGDEVQFLNKTSIDDGSGLNYTWDFDLGQVTSNLKNPFQNYENSGKYNVSLVVSSFNGCTNSFQQELEIYSLPKIDLDEDIATCSDAYTIDVSGSGETYSWSDGSVLPTIVINLSGRYSVSVTDSNNCVNLASTKISLNSQFEPSLGNDFSECDITILDAGNSGSKSYQWSTGDTTRQISVINSGKYLVTIVDQNNCIGTDSINVAINSSPIVELGENQSFCQGGSVLIDANNLGSKYIWSTGDTTQTIVSNQSGVYSVKVIDNNGCSNSDNIKIEVFDLPNVSLGDDLVTCDSIQLNSNSIWPSMTWSDGNTSSSIIVDNSGEYILSVIDSNKCTNSDSIEITISNSPEVDLGEDIKICSQQSVILDAGNPSLNHIWVTNDTTQIILTNSSGEYYVKVFNDNNCFDIDTVLVFVEPTVQVDLGDDQVLCKGQEYELNPGNNGGEFIWNSSIGITSNDQILTVGDSGTYWVDVTTRAGCKGVDSIQIFVVDQELNPDFVAVSSLTIGDTVQFVNVSEPELLSYTWNFNDGVTSLLEDPTHIFFTDGEFNVSLTVSNGVCSETITKPIQVYLPKLEDDTSSQNYSLYSGILSADIFPVPSITTLNVEIELENNSDSEIQIYSTSGLKLFAKSYNESSILDEIDIQNFPNGVYFLKLNLANDSRVIRFVKM